MSRIVKPTPPTPQRAHRPHRRYAWTARDLADVKRIRGAHGGTVNDVVLALITRGFRDLLRSRGEATDRAGADAGRCPSRCGPADGAAPWENRVSAMFAELPIGIEDPVARLGPSACRSRTSSSRSGGGRGGAHVVLGLRPADAAGARRSGRHPRRPPDGPAQHGHDQRARPAVPLYLSGAACCEACPYVPLAAPVRVGVAIFSYDGELVFGVTGDYDCAPDIDVLVRGISNGLTELLPTKGTPHQRRTPKSASAPPHRPAPAAAGAANATGGSADGT